MTCLIEIDGESKSRLAWSKSRGFPDNKVHDRVRKGWDPRAAVLGELDETKFSAHTRLGLAPVTAMRERDKITKHVPVRMIEVDGVTRSARAWAIERGLPTHTLHDRLKRGWHEHAAVLGVKSESKQDAHARLGLRPAKGELKRGERRAKVGHVGGTKTTFDVRFQKKEKPAKVKASWTKVAARKPIAPPPRLNVGTTMDRALQHDLMTATQEREAFTKYNALREQYGAKSRQALAMRNWIIEQNQRLIGMYAHRFGVDLEERFADGQEGLIVAAERFDVTKGFRFSTYACWWVKHFIRRRFDDSRSTVRVPIHLQEKLRYGKVEQDGVALTSGTVSLDARIGDDNDATRYNFVACENERQDHEYEREVAADRVHALILQQLGPREREVVVRRFGLDGEDTETLDQIGERFGLSRERVRQVERDCLTKMRMALKRERSVAL